MRPKLYWFFTFQSHRPIEFFTHDDSKGYDDNPDIFGPFDTFREAKSEAISRVTEILKDIRNTRKNDGDLGGPK